MFCFFSAARCARSQTCRQTAAEAPAQRGAWRPAPDRRPPRGWLARGPEPAPPQAKPAGRQGPSAKRRKKSKQKKETALSLSLLTRGWVERGGVVVAHVAGRPSQREIPASLLVLPAQPVTVVTGLFLVGLSPGYFSGLGPVDGAQTAEREKQNCVSLGGGRGGKKGVCTLTDCSFAYFVTQFFGGGRKNTKRNAHPRIPFLSSL